jgi:protein TonB
VFIQFVVNENGDVINPTVIRGRHELLDSEALRVIRLATFEPGRQRGKPVKVQLALPITFKLMKK